MKRRICNFAQASNQPEKKGAIYQRGQYYVLQEKQGRDPYKYGIYINDSLLGFCSRQDLAQRFCQSVYVQYPFETDVSDTMDLGKLFKKYRIKSRPVMKPSKAKAKPAAKRKKKSTPKPAAKRKKKTAPKPAEKPIQIQIRERNPNLAPADIKIELMKKLTKGKNPVKVEKYVSIIKKQFPNVDVVDLVTFYMENPVPLDVRNANVFVEDGSGLRFETKRIMYLYQIWALVDNKDPRRAKTNKILGIDRNLKSERTITKELQGLETAEIYTLLFEYLLDFSEFKKNVEFGARSYDAYVGSSSYKDILPNFVKMPMVNTRNLLFPRLYEFVLQDIVEPIAAGSRGLLVKKPQFDTLQSTYKRLLKRTKGRKNGN
jgi:hypothetical protein